MKKSLWILFTCLLIGYLYTDHCHAAPANDDVEYQSDDYDYGEEESGNAETPISNSEANDEIQSSPPYFEQIDIAIDAKPGDDVIVNCDARNFQISNAVVWYKNQTILANGQVAINNRVEVMKNNSILIRDVMPEDADDYYCVVLPQNVRQHTRLRVGARLSIFCDGRDITDRSQTFKQGDHHKLECRTYLPTKANIKWSFNGQRVEGSAEDVENGVIVLENIDEENVGVYQCLGDDGSREPPHGMVTIDVQYSPKVSTHRHHVNAEAGGTAELYCDYRANPIAINFWLKNGKVLDLSEKHTIKNTIHKAHNRTILTVKNIEPSDLDDYYCHVENAIGHNEVLVKLSYHPETPQFEDMSIEGNKVTLHWLVRSLQPLSEAMLDYKLSGSYTWSTVSVIKTHRHGENSGIWKITHQMELKPGSWRAHVKTRNTKGWSNFSPDHEFVVGRDTKDDDSNEISDSELPPDDLMRAGFNIGGTASTMSFMPTILMIIGSLLLRL